MVLNLSMRGSGFEHNDCGQDGSILIAASVFLLVGVILLGSIQIGYMYYTKRELQKTADLAALSGVQSLWQGCDAAGAAAVAAASENFDGATITTTCSAWNGDGQNASGSINVLNVEASAPASPIVPFFGSGTTIQAQARAVTSPVAAFSIGSRLLSVDSGLVSSILTAAGLDPTKLTVLDSSAITGIDITPSGLLSALHLPTSVISGIGTPDQLADLKRLTLGDLLSAVATVVGTNSDLSAAVNLLGGSTLASNPINLFGDGGVLALPSVDPSSALNTKIGVGNLIETALVVANGANAVNTNVQVPSILGKGAVSLIVTAPPSIAVGGKNTSTSNVQIEAKIPQISLLGIPIAGLSIDAVKSTGTLQDLCDYPSLERNQAQIGVQSSLADAELLLAGISVPLHLSGTEEPQDVVVTASTLTPFSVPALQQSVDVDSLVSALVAVVFPALGKVTQALLQPLLGPLDSLLGQVLDLLGLNVSGTDVMLYSVQCASPRLVQ